MLKVYKKTIILCFWVTIPSFFASVLLEFLNLKQLTLFINYLTGIACSAFVVFLTTLLQYRIEKYRVKREFAAALERLFFYIFLSFTDDEENIDDRLYEYLFGEMDQAFKNSNNYCGEFCCFGKTGKKKHDEVFRNISLLYFGFITEQLKSKKASILRVVRHQNLIKAADAAISFLEEGFECKQITHYRDEMKKELIRRAQQKANASNK